MKNVLIVDIDPVLLRHFTGLLKSHSGFLTVFSASSVERAMEVMASNTIHLVVSGLKLPAIAGFDLFNKIVKRYPDTGILLLHEHLTPNMHEKIKQTPNARYLDPSVNMGLLYKHVFTALGINYGGRIRGVSLPSFLQMMELENRSCTLHIQSKSDSGYVYMAKGACISATCRDLDAREAALEMLTWESVTIDIDFHPPEVARDIETPLMILIMESGRKADDAARERADQRQYKRFQCEVAIDFDVSQLTHQSALRDISLGGAYVETDQAVAPGEKILLSLTPFSRNGECVISGTVTRKHDNGLAIAFEALSLQQKKIVNALITHATVDQALADDLD